VFAEHISLDPPQRGNNGIDLVRDVNAVSLGFDHVLEAADLSFYSTQPWQLFLVINLLVVVTFMMFLRLV
jgi:hypothetical protein